MSDKMGSISRKIASGVGWMVLWRLSSRALGIVSLLIVARLLLPDDFGLVAFATTLMIGIESLSALGLQDAIVRSRHSDRVLLDTAFTLATIRGLLTGVALAAAAAPLSRYFHEPRLELIIYCLAVLAAVEGLENIGIVEFRREMNFRSEFFLFIFPRLTGVILNIILAIVFRNYWALVASIIITRACRFLMTYIVHPYRPRFSLKLWRDLLSFSFWAWLSNIFGFVKDRTPTLVLGRFFDASAIGTFSLGVEIALLPVTELIAPIGRVLFSGFAMVSRAGADIADGFFRSVGVIATLMFPAGIGVSAIGASIVSVALGSSWRDAIPVLEILGLMAPFSALAITGNTLLVVRGNLRVNVVICFSCAILVTVGSLVLVQFLGLSGVALSMVIGAFIESASTLAFLMLSMNSSFSQLVSAIWRPILASGVMAVVLVSTGLGWCSTVQPFSTAVVVAPLSILLGAITYISTLMLAWTAAGRPTAAETYLLNVILDYSKSLHAPWQRRQRPGTPDTGTV
jgi:lipopolysaccharide exporter